MAGSNHNGPEVQTAARLRAARAYADMSRADMAKALGLSETTVKRMEGGQRRLTSDDLETIARVCGVPLAFLLEGFQRDRDAIALQVAGHMREIEDAHERAHRALEELERLQSN